MFYAAEGLKANLGSPPLEYPGLLILSTYFARNNTVLIFEQFCDLDNKWFTNITIGGNIMKAPLHARLLIVDDDRRLCDALRETISAWGIETRVITKPSLVANQVRDCFYNIVLLDIVMPEQSGFDLIPEIRKFCPETKIIIMSGYADKEKALKALRLSVFDFLEKPIKTQLLLHSVMRALDTQKIELELKKTIEELKRSQSELLNYKLGLEQANEQLLETNKALSVLAKNIEMTGKESEKRIILKIRSLIIPIVEKLQRDKNLERYKAELSMLMAHIETLTSGLAGDTEIADRLSSTELRIVSMVVNGLTSQEIAKPLHVSLSTVKTHRRNIRRKLNISRSNCNLRTYLESRMGKGQRIPKTL
jgi:FixJ family two-component response regulator